MERKFCVFLISIFSILVFLIFSFPSLLFLFGFKNTKYEENTKTVVISHFNSISNETTFGFAKIPPKIFQKNREFISYKSKNREIYSVITSKFSNNEFECYGTCSCNEKASSDRRTINILSKSLYFIISTFSLSLAIKIATDYFSEECFDSLRNICSSENIETEINFCESKYGIKGEYYYDPITGELVPKNSNKEETSEIEKEIEKEEKYEGFEREYHCEGYCTPNGNLRREEPKYESEKFECEKYRQEGKVKIVETGKLGFLRDESYSGNSKAKHLFEKVYLGPYCKSISKYSYEYVYRGQVIKSNVKLCNARSLGGRYGNICCYLLDPFSSMDGRREKAKIGDSFM